MKGVKCSIYVLYGVTQLKRRCSLLFFLLGACLVLQSQESANFSLLDRTFRFDSQVVFDSLGYVWISDDDGLYRYDGYDYFFTSYSEIFEKPHTNPRNIIFTKDVKGDFWLATRDGELSRIRPGLKYTSFKDSISKGGTPIRISAIQAEENFVWFGSDKGTIFRYNYETAELDSVSTVPLINDRPQLINGMAFTDARTMWVSTFSGIVYKYARTGYGNPWERLNGPYFNPLGGITKVVSDDSGYLWITAEYKGLFSYNPNRREFKNYRLLEGPSEQKNVMLLCLFYDDDNHIWAGTDGNGLYRVDLKTDKVDVFAHNNANRLSLSSNTVVKINKDPHGNIWVSTKKGFINILPGSNNNISYYSGSDKGVPTTVLSMLKAADGSIWLGTDGMGINRVFPDGASVQYNAQNKNGNYFRGSYVQGLVEDSKNNIWVATYRNGLFVYDGRSGKFKDIELEDKEGNTSNDARYLLRDSKDRIWVTSTAGIHVFTEELKELATFDYHDYGLSGSISVSLVETSDGTLWVGMGNGKLFKFIPNRESFSNSRFEPVKPYNDYLIGPKNYWVTSMVADKDDNLWLANLSGFLTFYNPNTLDYVNFENKGNLDDINIQSLLFVEGQKLWLGSTSGLHEYDVRSGDLKSYFMADGLQGNSYKRRSAFKSNDGMLFFGGQNGANAFFAENMVKKEVTPKLLINTIEIIHKPAGGLIPEQLPNGVENVKSLDLKHEQSSFTFRFSAIENVLNTNYYYAYRLKGFDKDWIVPKSDRRATYTNVPHGDYVFEVKAGIKRGVWDIPAQRIQIAIAAPWWLTGWAYALYGVCLLFLVLGLYRWALLRNRLKREEWEFNNEKELYALKMNFFAKMSHEIQTPLSLILGLIDDMLQKASANKNQLLMQRLRLIKNNAERLSRISTDLTTVRNKELDQLKIRVSKNDIIKDLRHIALSFAEQARFKKIDFIQEYPKKEIWLWYDQEKIEHVFYNLLSNAFKFTPSEGTIRLKVARNKKKERLKISVIDSGPGIAKSELKHIFTMYYQSETGKSVRGSGIGLTLTKELIEMHHGRVKVDSSREKGSAFNVFLSLRDDIFKTEEKVEDLNVEVLGAPDEQSFDNLEKDLEGKETVQGKPVYTVLIVEDNIEMQIFLKNLLGKTYKVGIAENGQEGLKLAETLDPDIIVSDIMMPVMDGVEMTHSLQKNTRLAHIPIILLTAKNTTKSKMLGLESGAVAYINKPFSPQELMLKINNLIASRESTILKAKTDFISGGGAPTLPPSKDHIFLKELVDNLNEHLETPGFKLELLAEKMHMSYSVIYRKCQEITGRTLVDFFRSLKMKRAALLIIEQGYNISEAAFMVGYKDAKYFAKCFKEEFGLPPAALKRETKKLGLSAVTKKYSLESV